VRFLNGQVTQDVRRIAGGTLSLASCVTDAKGKLQFRVTVTDAGDGVLWVAGPDDSTEALEARLTRYLIADDVETEDLTGQWFLAHFLGEMPTPPVGVSARTANRYGVDGIDWWLPLGRESELPDHSEMATDEREALRISHGIPLWGRELVAGMLPPEAALEATDISYAKGCYVGQEVISRIKSAGKTNKRLTRFSLPADAEIACGPLENGAGEITSISPVATDGARDALGYLKRNAAEPYNIATAAGVVAVSLR
jgi:folate-binding protein YgfZ